MKRLAAFGALALGLGLASSSQATTLPVSLIVQEQTNWCWAGSSQCVLGYFGATVAQCKMAEFVRNVVTWHSFGPVDCCVDPSQGCNYGNRAFGYAGSIQEVLERWGLGTANAWQLSIAAVQTEIDAGRPFIIGWVWDSSGGHAIVGHGLTGDIMNYMDPWPGEGFKTGTHAWVTLGGGHTWNTTNLVTTPPLCLGAAEGTPCDDGDACTAGETCVSGACKGGLPSTCTALNQCYFAGTCNLVTGQCSQPVKPNNTQCDDNDACTVGDSCHSGVCSGIALTCKALDSCHDPGECNPATGVCSQPTKPDGAACSDGNGCTQGDTCQEGLCFPGAAVVCGAPDACHLPGGTCAPATGQCVYATKPEGTGCDDGNACTQGDACYSGVCTGGSAVACPAPDSCHQAGACNPATGQCHYPTKPDGAGCEDGNACTVADTCQGGVCVGGSPTQCAPPGACQQPGQCSPATGQCSYPAKPEGTGCDDGNACTQSDTCQSGACVGGNPINCVASDSCHLPGVCDSVTGGCSNPEKPEGAGCEDGNSCTQNDVCKAGLCTAGPLVVCTAQDDCHEPGTCDPSQGTCTNPPKPDGSPCTGGHCYQGICDSLADAAVDTALDTALESSTEDSGQDVAVLDAVAQDSPLAEGGPDSALDSGTDVPLESAKDGALDVVKEVGKDSAAEAHPEAQVEASLKDSKPEASKADSAGAQESATPEQDSGCGCAAVGSPVRFSYLAALGAFLSLLRIRSRSRTKRPSR